MRLADKIKHSLLVLSLVATSGLFTSAQAEGLFAPGARPEFSANIGGTTDYVFRGISQSLEDPTAQGGVDMTWGIFYAGVWASGVDFVAGNPPPNSGDADIEVDLYLGITPKWGPATFDFGFIYYAYPGAQSLATGAIVRDLDYVEVKAGVSGEIVPKLSAGFTAYYSPDYFAETGEVWTLEGTLGYEFPAIWKFTPTLDGTVGTSLFSSNDPLGGDYVFWNVGLGLSAGNLTLDLRYHDSDEEGFAALPGLSDERFVFSATYSFP